MKGLLGAEGESAQSELYEGRSHPKIRQFDTIRKLKPMGLVFLIGTVLTLWALRSSLSTDQEINVVMPDPAKYVVQTDLPLEVKALIQKIKDARLLAEKANPNATTEFTEGDLQSWHGANPCISRQEFWPAYNARRHSEILHEHPYLAQVLSEYSKLHRACMQNVGKDIVGFFLRNDTSSGCKFILGDTETGTGIGNKILSTAAAVVYAIVTQRVLLVPDSTYIPGIMCEPFEGSSWRIATDGILTPGKDHPDKWRPVSSVTDGVDNVHRGWRNVSAIYAASVTKEWDYQPLERFFCDAEQAFYASHVTWMYFSEALYYLPKLFAVPRFRATLEALFPHQMVLTHILRTALLPADSVWLRVQQLNQVHLKHVDHRIGIQERYFHGKSDFELLHEVTEVAVAKCLLENHLLPNTSTVPETLNPNPGRSMPTYLVFITSLYDSLKDHLTRIYLRSPARTREAVGLLQLTHEDRQEFGDEVDKQALAEVLGLSLCDTVVLTPQSTFGAVAAAYGGLVPFFIDIRPNTTSPGCVRGHSIDACFQLPSSKHFNCPHNSDVDGQLIADVVPYIHDCHVIETPFVKWQGRGLGLQIMSRYNESLAVST